MTSRNSDQQSHHWNGWFTETNDSKEKVVKPRSNRYTIDDDLDQLDLQDYEDDSYDIYHNQHSDDDHEPKEHESNYIDNESSIGSEHLEVYDTDENETKPINEAKSLDFSSSASAIVAYCDGYEKKLPTPIVRDFDCLSSPSSIEVNNDGYKKNIPTPIVRDFDSSSSVNAIEAYYDGYEKNIPTPIVRDIDCSSSVSAIEANYDGYIKKTPTPIVRDFDCSSLSNAIEANNDGYKKYIPTPVVKDFDGSTSASAIEAKYCDYKKKSPTSIIVKDFDLETSSLAAPIKNIKFILPDAANFYGHEKFKKPSSSLDWNDYYPLEVIHNFLDDLEYNYPSLCTSAIIGHSVEGRELKIVKISNSDVHNQCVWIDAGIHAREWIAPAVNTYIANYIASNFDKLPEYCKNKDWYFLPVLNPDGYEYSHTTNRMWRKNRAWCQGECTGVDLNRNFSFGWGGPRSSDQPNHAFYRGQMPFSEPESRALRDLFLTSGLDFQVYITLHSYGQVIVFPFACTEALAPDYVRLLGGATAMSKAIYETNGNIYKVGISKDVMYGASGTSSDWCHGVAGIPYCYLIELRSRQHKFKLPKEQIEETGYEILNSVVGLLSYADGNKPSKVTDEAESTEDSFRKSDLPNRSESDKISVKVALLPDNTQVWEINFTAEGQRDFVKTLDTQNAINIWNQRNSTMDIMVEGPRAGQVAGLLHERDIPYSVAVPDVVNLMEKGQAGYFSQSCKKHSTAPCPMDWKSYHTLETIYAFMHNLAADYPYLVKIRVIGKSVEGRDLKILIISNGDENNSRVWLDGSIHPREWISAAVVTYIADRIVRTFHEQPESVTNKDWYIHPVLNPDGYEYTHTHDRMWRKNRARFGECVGVDLNRNFSHGWGEKDEEGSSVDPGNIFYRGPKPFSEPETVAVKKVIMECPSKFKVFLSFHSYGEVIIFPWGYTNEACPDYIDLLEGGTVMAKAIHKTSGRIYKVGSTKDLMYYSAGTSIDWSYGVAKIPFSYMFELPAKTYRFLLPKEEIINCANEVYNGILRFMDFVDSRL